MSLTLTPDQLHTLRDAVRTRANYLHRVKLRMYERGAAGDPLYALYDQAEAALTRLATELHSRSIVVADRRPWEAGGTAEG